MENQFYTPERIAELEKAFGSYAPKKTETDGTVALTAKSGGGNELRIELSFLAVLGFKGMSSAPQEGFYFGIYHPAEAEFARLLSDVRDIVSGKTCAVNIKSSLRHDIMKLERIETPAEEEAARLSGSVSPENGKEDIEVRFNYFDSSKNAVFRFEFRGV